VVELLPDCRYIRNRKTGLSLGWKRDLGLYALIEIRIGPCPQIRRAFAIALLVPQCHQWVDSGCVTSWDVGGDGSDGE
jgi:hypothetical protein